jgi:hypothetical protein
MDSSLKPDPLLKGSYYRRIEDVERGLQSLEINRLSASVRFFLCYFGCEKIARGLVGIHKRWPAKKAYSYKPYLSLAQVKAAAVEFGLQVSVEDLNWLFADYNEQELLQSGRLERMYSARFLRNSMIHDFGPSNLARVDVHAPFLNPKLEAFLACAPTILSYQRCVKSRLFMHRMLEQPWFLHLPLLHRLNG